MAMTGKLAVAIMAGALLFGMPALAQESAPSPV